MTILEAYNKFKEKVNKNNTNDNLSVSKPRFISLFNEYQIKFVEYILDKRNEDDIRYISQLLTLSKPLVLSENIFNHYNFKLPNNFLGFADISVFGSDDDCDKVPLSSWEAKIENVNLLTSDEFNKPSIKYRETFYVIGGGYINVYSDNFSIDTVLLSYYRYPTKVDISGYINENGLKSIDIDPEFDDKVVNRVLDACVKGFDFNSENLQKLQLDYQQLFSKI